MASLDMIDAACETGFMEKLYSVSHRRILKSTIDLLSGNFGLEIFGDSETLDSKEWIKKSHLSDMAWLFSFASIR